MTVDDAETQACRAAIDALERVIRQQSREPYEDLATAARCLVGLRDDLIRRKRAGESPERLTRDLNRVNSVLSAMHGSEFPLVGLRLSRIEQARDNLAELLNQI